MLGYQHSIVKPNDLKKVNLAFMTANGIASVGFVTGTALIGTIAIAYPGLWRLGLLLAIPVALILFFVGREKDADDHVPDEHGPQGGKLSRNFWISWFGFVACISSEFATSFWAAALLKERVGSTAAISTVASKSPEAVPFCTPLPLTLSTRPFGVPG